MKLLIIISSILIGSSESVLSQERQKELPPAYERLSLETRGYPVTVKKGEVVDLSSYILLEKDDALYLLPEKKSHQKLFCFLERRAISEQKYSRISSYRQWVGQYNGTLLNRAAYDFTDEWEYSFSSPLNALRSYWHALNNCDAELVLKYSDPSFVIYLERSKKWSLLASPPVYNNDGCTKITPLVKGTCEVGGKEYTMLFYRRECPVDPKSNRIYFHWDFFVLLNGTYYLSDAPATSQFGNMAQAMKLGFVYPAGKYDDLAEELKATSMPKEFYTIKD